MLAGLLLLVACEPPPPEESGVLVVVKDQTSAWVRNFNPMSPSARFPTQAGIYEPLAIYNDVASTWEPWLAESWAWRGDTTLAFTLREGVRWSDGHPLLASDVQFTYELALGDPKLDAAGLARFLDRVELESDRTIVCHLSRPYGPGFAALAHTLVLPEHVVGEVADPLTWTNPSPVGSGPFTEVRTFRTQVFELGRNPHYWQGPPPIEALRFPAIASNDQLAMALIQGEVDWSGGYVPQIDRVFVDRDPEHHGYWYPNGPSWFLYANTTIAPYDDVRVHKAMSLGLDRDLMIEVAGWTGFTQPDRGTGLTNLFAAWRSPEAEAASDWVAHDPDRARALLDDAGLRVGPEGVRTRADGSPLTIELSMVSGWSDAVRASQVAAQSLRAIGLDVRVRSYDPGAWFANTFRGEFELTTAWSMGGPDPYLFYAGLMGTSQVRPVGTAHFTNWHRYGSPRMDALLTAFEQTTDREAQREIAVEMQHAFVAEAPAIPLYAGPVWGQFNRTRFENWPSAENPYAPLSPNPPYTPLFVMTQVRPRDRRSASNP